MRKKFSLSKRANTLFTGNFIDILQRIYEIINFLKTTGANFFYKYPTQLGIHGVVTASIILKNLYKYITTTETIINKLKNIIIDIDNVVIEEIKSTNNKEHLYKLRNWRNGLISNGNKFSGSLNSVMINLNYINKNFDIPLSKLNRDKFNSLYNKIDELKFDLFEKINKLEILSNLKRIEKE